MALNGFDTRVTWLDFRNRSTRPPGVREDAEIEAASSMSYRTIEENGVWSVASADAGVSPDRNQSWVLSSAKTDALLAHEQGHFDITALGAREVYNRILGVTGSSAADLRRTINSIKVSVQANIDQTNEQYDIQTDHGNNTASQQRWEARIRTAKDDPDGTLNSL
jgi:hypothetical protein